MEDEKNNSLEYTIENSCRVCLSSYNLVGIFQKHEGKIISEMITEISGVEVKINDSLSKKICKECKSKVIEFYAFRAMCIDSDYTVRFNIPFVDEIEDVELLPEENKRSEEELNQLEEYFIEDEESVTNSEFQEHLEDQHANSVVFDEEMFINDDADDNDDEESQDDHQILADVESISSFDVSSNTKNSVVIERVGTKAIGDNSIIFEPSDELTMKMREAHFAKEQQKKHKCPHCEKFFLFPSKGNF